MKGILLDAGFTDVEATAFFDTFGTPESVAVLHTFINEWFFSPHVIATATALGTATQEQFDVWREEMDQWRDHPSSFAALAFGECIAFKP